MFFATAASRRVQSALLAGLETGQGCLFLVTGEVGIGKTMQLHVLEAVLRVAGETVMVHDGADGSASWLDRLAGAGADRTGRPAVDLVDNAENFSAATIDRLVAALRLSEGKGFPARLVIAARSEIEPRLYPLVGAALSTQASFNWLRLDNVDGFDIESLVLHRLRRVGFADVSPITPEALRRIIQGSGGVPRKILELSASEFECMWRQVAISGGADGESRGRGRPTRRAFGAASLPLLVAGAWMLLPTDVIRRVETSDGRFVVETFAGTPAIETTPIVPPGAAIAALVPPEPPLPVREHESPTSIGDPIEDDEGQVASAGSDDGESSSVNLSKPDSVVMAPLPVIVPHGSEPAPDETGMAVVQPLDIVAMPVEERKAIAGSPASEADGAAPTVVLAQGTAPPVLSAEQIAALIRRGDEQLREGSVAGARLFYERAAVAGDANAMRALARTYDAQELRRLGVVGLVADPERGRFWLKRAEETDAAARARPK